LLKVFLLFCVESLYADAQRAGLCAGWEIAFRLPITAVDNCNIADVLFISQIYYV